MQTLPSTLGLTIYSTKWEANKSTIFLPLSSSNQTAQRNAFFVSFATPDNSTNYDPHKATNQ
jgi:hypothetical protein